MVSYVFKRYENKYILTPQQYEAILQEVEKRMDPDEFGETTIQSLYYDTPNARLVRTSIEKPKFKEKIRVRSYGLATKDSKVYVELKRKSQGVVYKRRLSAKEDESIAFFENKHSFGDGQIAKEIDYFKNYYGKLQPYILILYDRIAFKKREIDLRITFDRNTRYRATRLTLSDGLDGTLLLEPGHVLMEIKSSLGFPRWLVDLLNEQKSYKRSFSKVGEAHKRELILSMQEEKKIV
jgi:hypothetical protein